VPLRDAVVSALSKFPLRHFATSSSYRPRNLRDMSDRDLMAIHSYLRHLGPAGEPAPAFVPADIEPRTPVVSFGGPAQ